MAFWSSQIIRERIPEEQIVAPYDPGRVIHSAYELGVGAEAFITSNPSDNALVSAGTKIVIPPGQFGLLITGETVHVPNDTIAFISIRAGIKFRGLINVSGFHVDPGYQGQLKFAVYNAGSQPIVLDQDQRVFMIWFADLDQTDDTPYPERILPPHVITSDDIAKIQGEVASPGELKKLFDDLRNEMDLNFHKADLAAQFNRWVLGVLITLVLGVIGWIIRPMVVGSDKTDPSSPAQKVAPAAGPDNKPEDKGALPKQMPRAN